MMQRCPMRRLARARAVDPIASVRVGIAAAAIVFAGVLGGCAGVPPLPDRPASHALPPSTESQLGRNVAAMTQQQPGRSGLVAVDDGRAAFGVRIALTRIARRSIDIQTFVWHGDAAGTLLFDELLNAAERGVRVRLLLDDMNTAGIDATLALMARQPNIEVRLYNPFVNREWRTPELIGDFARLNRRMHNKSFTMDGIVSVVGGRNIADEYFEIGDTGFVDLDVVAIGDVVASVSTQFDAYWNSPSAVPAGPLLAGVAADSVTALRERARAIRETPVAGKYTAAAMTHPVVQDLVAGTLRVQWASAIVAYDEPDKTTATADRPDLQLLPQLRAWLAQGSVSFDVISPYFVPGDAGTEALVELARRGVRVRVLTNSLSATDEKSVHAGYAHRREALLRGGVELYELKRDAGTIVQRAQAIGRGSTAALHAKTYVIDGRWVFVGSFNLDPRSSKLNTEMGLLIDSPEFARPLASIVDRAYPALAYRLRLASDGSLRWEDGQRREYDADPHTDWLDRAIVDFESWLPIEWLL
jgi:putative cardiolipin synthase